LLKNINCAVYEMRCNKYPLEKLEMIRLGRLSLSDFN